MTTFAYFIAVDEAAVVTNIAEFGMINCSVVQLAICVIQNVGISDIII